MNTGKKKNWRLLKLLIAAGLAMTAIVAGVLVGYGYFSVIDLPEVSALENYRPAEVTKMFSADGNLLGEFYLERRTFISLNRLPSYAKNAFIAIEDERFFEHDGIDLYGILRALWVNIQAGKVEQGGSTITQQLAKMLFLKPERSLERKIKEAALALEIEKRYTKPEILEIYVNQTFFGAGAYGIEAAAQIFFGKSAADLTVAQAALIAGLPKAPTVYNPKKNLKLATTRMYIVLSRMRDLGYISEQDYQKAKNEKIALVSTDNSIEAPYFYEYMRQTLEKEFEQGLYTSGLNIYTTLNTSTQNLAEEAVAVGVDKIEARCGKGVEAALVAIELKNGYLRAMVGGKDFQKSQFNRAVQARRQPGSSFKPVVYATAFNYNNKDYTPDKIMLDEPVVFLNDSKPWTPNNYTFTFKGPITMKKALAQSINSIAIQLTDEVGIHNVIDMAKKLGLTGTFTPYLPMALGTADVTLLEMVNAYAVFANQGVRNDVIAYEKITDRNGYVIKKSQQSPIVVFDKKIAAQMDEILKAVVQEGTAKGALSLLKYGVSPAGKTGTTDDYVDAWFIGYTQDMAIGVWVGRDNNKPIGPKQTGATAALPIWIDFVKKLYQTTKKPGAKG